MESKTNLTKGVNLSQEFYRDVLLRRREELNQRLANTVQHVLQDRFLVRQTLDSMLPGRKVRSILFVELLEALDPEVSSTVVDDVVFAIEGIHAASVLVDDVLDNDSIRHGTSSVSHRWGNNPSVLFAHLLAGSALSKLSAYPALQERLLTVYRQMSLGEMYDLMIPPGTWRHGGYDCRTSQKTYALFGFAVGSAAVVAGATPQVDPLDQLGKELGFLYQIGNDYHDWQPKNLLKRHSPSDTWPITFSFPLAVYLQKHGSREIQAFLKRRHLPHSDWQRLLRQIWRPEVKAACREALRKCLRDVLANIETNIKSPKVRGLYAAIAKSTVREQFWYQPYQVR
jgi:geranylgeranyl diphosphate synthase, type I